jgi:hypothetical protein
MPIRALTTIVFFFALGGIGNGANAQTVYVWTAGDGSLVHADRPPGPGIKFQIQATAGGTPKQSENEADITTQLEPEDKSSSMLGVDLDASYCQRAQSNLKTLDSFTQIRTRDGEGNYRYLTIEEKQEQRQQAMLLMEQYCN